MMNAIVPTDPEASKAIQEFAKATGQGIEAATKFGQFWARVFGTVPEDVVAVLGGSWLHNVRIRQEFRLMQCTLEILGERGIKEPQAVSEDIARPLLEAAREQSNAELSELWARLLANASDPNRSAKVRRSHVDLLRQFDPSDAAALRHFSIHSFNIGDDTGMAASGVMTIAHAAQNLKINANEMELSLVRLTEMKCLTERSPSGDLSKRVWVLAPRGRLLLAAVE